MSDRISFTVERLERVPAAPTGKRVYLLDAKVPGLLLCVTDTGNKSFQVRKRMPNGGGKRVTLGRYPGLTIDQARRMAQATLAKLAEGIDPAAEKRAVHARNVSLAEAFRAYVERRKNLRPATVKDYEFCMAHGLRDWASKPLHTITRKMVTARHTLLSGRSESLANKTMRFLRALFNFAAGEYLGADGRPILTDNPVKALSHAKTWNREVRRTRHLGPHQLRAWLEGIEQLPLTTEDGAMYRDYLLLLLFTGLRRSEAANLTWENVDLDARTLFIPGDDAKNHEPHRLPLPDVLLDMLAARKRTAAGAFVFAVARTGKPPATTLKACNRVAAASGVPFSPHDLRRTFLTIAESLDIPAYALKRLANHKMKGDVTAGYIVTSVERLRKPMQQIADFILSAAGKTDSGQVLPITVAKAGPST